MTVLSAQSIRRLCGEVHGGFVERRGYQLYSPGPLITPYTEAGTVNGKSYGLSACTYDCRIDHDLELYPIPLEYIWAALGMLTHPWSGTESHVTGLRDAARVSKWAALASTIEQFNIPADVCGSVLDKSTYARVFVSAFNTHLDPGWRSLPEVPGKERNHLTVELVNLGTETVMYRRGDPVCQVKFQWLDEPTDLPYAGKYLGQGQGPQPARYGSP